MIRGGMSLPSTMHALAPQDSQERDRPAVTSIKNQTPSEPARHSFLQRVPASVLLTMLGILIQTPVILLAANDPRRALPPGDPPGYLLLAQNLLAHGAFSTFMAPPYAPEIFRTPGYPIFLATLLALGGGSLLVVLIAQSVLRILSALLLEKLATDQLHSTGLGLAAGALWLLAPIPALYAGVIAPETLFTLLLLLALYALRGDTPRGLACSGFILGIAVLVRPIGAILIAGFIPLVWIGHKKGYLRALLFLLAAGFALAPWLARNELAFNRLALSSVSGNNLLNYNMASCLGQRNGGDWKSGVGLAEERYQAYLAAHHLRPASDVEASDAMTTVAVQIFFESPLECAAINLADTWNSLRPGASYAMLYFRPDFLSQTGSRPELSPAVAAMGDPLVFAVTMLLSIWYVGLYLATLLGICVFVAKRRWFALCCWLLPTAILLISPGTAGNARFRIPVEPALSFFAIAGAAWMYAQGRTYKNKIRDRVTN
jgi:hypothetical protein